MKVVPQYSKIVEKEKEKDMSEGVGTYAQTEPTPSQEGKNEDPQAPKTQEGQVKEPETELKPGENTHTTLEAHPEKKFIFKKIVTSSFCFECGRQAYYFAVKQNEKEHWERYLCEDDLQKEKSAAESDEAPKQSVQAQALQQKNEELKTQYEGLQQQSQKFGEAMGQKDEEIAKKEQEESQKPDDTSQQT